RGAVLQTRDRCGRIRLARRLAPRLSVILNSGARESAEEDAERRKPVTGLLGDGDGALDIDRLQTVEEVDGALCVCRGREYRALALAQELQPVGDVGGMILARLGGDLELSAQERGADLSDQLLAGVAGVAEPLRAKITSEPLRMRRPVSELVCLGRG